jgi:hypothetical protein
MKNNIESFTDLDITSREEKPTLWVFGCSLSYGIGLRPHEKTYGILLAEKLSMPLKQMARQGTSTHFSLRHLVNANIQEDDVIVWQLTTAERFSYLKHNHVIEIILPLKADRKFIDFFTDDQLYFQQLSLLNIGVNYLRAKKAKFAISSILSQSITSDKLLNEYVKYPEYCFTPNYEVDKGTDNLHSGPLSHQNLSNSLYNHIQYLYD